MNICYDLALKKECLRNPCRFSHDFFFVDNNITGGQIQGGNNNNSNYNSNYNNNNNNNNSLAQRGNGQLRGGENNYNNNNNNTVRGGNGQSRSQGGAVARNRDPCYEYRNTGTCHRARCQYLHENPAQSKPRVGGGGKGLVFVTKKRKQKTEANTASVNSRPTFN